MVIEFIAAISFLQPGQVRDLDPALSFKSVKRSLSKDKENFHSSAQNQWAYFSTRTPLSTVDTNQFSSHSIKSRLSWNQNQTGTNSGVVVRDLDSAIGFKSVDVTLHKDEENVPSSAHHQGNSGGCG
ncbi:hypothetical protein DCAR_0100970 [Daucus carota subsp. sativus]|uniref:Uncharacterized protein n=1 Tax=Daucus carota subsp. sativus TaxID=79200 RepID=A0A166G2C3_DAUCS|nr:hypothetical protein DCAR_0100970 [Daucus carota subsp. sativus]